MLAELFIVMPVVVMLVTVKIPLPFVVIPVSTFTHAPAPPPNIAALFVSSADVFMSVVESKQGTPPDVAPDTVTGKVSIALPVAVATSTPFTIEQVIPVEQLKVNAIPMGVPPF